ncbi:glycoside hydrolase superfamily [Apodospora peruviana]|uniref:chitinase n=1 Tax=Apodospora peruviana TaxID=516989 RepID=A0AAE0II20_9PEZI|nr:glycoside hydrolase superfamily [Apodospora peruviana]
MMLLFMRTTVHGWAALGTLLLLYLTPNTVAASSASLSSSSSSTTTTTTTPSLLPIHSKVNSTRPGFNFSVPTNSSSSTSLPRNGSEIYKAKFAAHDPKAPKFVNLTGININPLFEAAQALQGKKDNAQLLAARQVSSTGLPEGACAPGTPCANGACCSNEGWCGYSPSFCGAGVCISNCDAKAECGQYAAVGKETCPLNVCCSIHGFCGTTEEFCGTTCDNTFGNCGSPPSPSCPASRQTARRRKIGYYEGWAPTRPCDKREPEDLVLSGFTHLNFAFAFFHPTTFQMTAMDDTSAALYSRFTALKKKAPGLQTWISVGGWSFNDETNVPNTRTAFSDMVSTAANRATFIASLTHFMSAYGFDGIDLDWEYPGADDRGGRKEDRANFVALLRDMRAAWGSRFGITATLPSSYWYLQHFDLPGMEPYLDWFNIMSYDIHGVWDSSSVWAGPYVRPHTNLTEIDMGLSLLWRVNVDPSKVVLGLGWYGRSFMLSNPSCNTPWCTFTAGGKPGACSGEAGILSNAEVFRTVQQRGLTPVIDENAAVAYVSWDDQWVSYDTAKTMAIKMTYADAHCLGGSMVWAVDLDDERGTSLGNADPNYRIMLSCMFSPCNSNPFGRAPDTKSIFRRSTGGDACYTSFCGAGCEPASFPTGSSVIRYLGYAEVFQMSGHVGQLPMHSECPAGSWQSLCCATGTQYGTCQWRGYGGFLMTCRGGCEPGETEVAQNTNHIEFNPIHRSQTTYSCFGGSQSYCCSDFEPPVEMPELNLIEAEGAYSDWENIEGWSDWRIEQEAADCPDLSVLITSNGAQALTNKGIPVDLGLVKRGQGSTGHLAMFNTGYLFCFTVNSVYRGVVQGGVNGYAANKQIYTGIGLPLGNPTKNPHQEYQGCRELGAGWGMD